MADYYGNAQLAILASSAADSRDGFLGTRTRHPVSPCRFAYNYPTLTNWDGIEAGYVYAELPSSHDIGPLQRCAWTFQEHTLSPRSLIFGGRQI